MSFRTTETCNDECLLLYFYRYMCLRFIYLANFALHSLLTSALEHNLYLPLKAWQIVELLVAMNMLLVPALHRHAYI